MAIILAQNLFKTTKIAAKMKKATIVKNRMTSIEKY
jgi:hypothetical protein